MGCRTLASYYNRLVDCDLLSCNTIRLCRLLNPKYGGNTLLRNTGNQKQDLRVRFQVLTATSMKMNLLGSCVEQSCRN
jgi:hypothetical protein